MDGGWGRNWRVLVGNNVCTRCKWGEADVGGGDNQPLMIIHLYNLAWPGVMWSDGGMMGGDGGRWGDEKMGG